MRKKINPEKKNTKDLILEAAFSFYSKPCYQDFSMSQLAAKVGITKTAIYRHYESKEEVILAMQNRFYDLFAARILDLHKAFTDEKTLYSNENIVDITNFFVENSQYINYFISQFAVDPRFENTIRDELLKRGVNENFLNCQDEDNEMRKYTHSVFRAVSFLFFIKAREQYYLCQGKKIPDSKNFSEKLIKFTNSGISGIFSGNKELKLHDISKERMEELDKYCKVDPSILPEEDKVFTALATVIAKYNISGVTVEKIADELNMAKSSLYFYFDNKNQMIFSLVEKELNLLVMLISENTAEAETYAEHIYISMCTEMNFFLQRKSIIPICGWLLQTSTENNFSQNNFSQKRDDEEPNNFWESKISNPVKEIDLGFSFGPKMLTYWYGILPVALVVLSMKHNFNEKKTEDAVRYVFNYVLNGISKK